MCAPKKPPSWFRLHTWFQLIVTTYVALGIIPVCQNLRHGFVYTTFILICGFVTIQLCKRNRGSDIKRGFSKIWLYTIWSECFCFTVPPRWPNQLSSNLVVCFPAIPLYKAVGCLSVCMYVCLFLFSKAIVKCIDGDFLKEIPQGPP